jgi:hypothetical protein
MSRRDSSRGAVDYIARALARTAQSLGSGVTQIVTGFGLTGGTITTSGTIAIDTVELDNRYANVELATMLTGPIRDNEVVLSYPIGFDGSIAADFSDWRVGISGVVDATVVLSVQINHSGVGTITFTPPSTIALATDNNDPVSFVSGDVIRIVADATAEANTTGSLIRLAAILGR